MDAASQEIVAFRPSYQAVARMDDWEALLPAVEALANGRPSAEAAQLVGVRPGALNATLRRHPELLAEMKGFREVLRESAQLRALAELHARLDTSPAEISGRDLTDILRATKPYDDGQAARVTIKFDVPL